MFHMTQWTRSAPSSSRLSTIRARLTVPSGRPSQASGGEMFGTLAEIAVQVLFLGIRRFSLNTGLVKTMLDSNCCWIPCPESDGSGATPPAPAVGSAGAAGTAPPASPAPSSVAPSPLEQPAASAANISAAPITAREARILSMDNP